MLLFVYVNIWVDVQALPEQPVPGKRQGRMRKLKTMAGTLLDLQNDITDPITQVRLLDTPLTGLPTILPQRTE